MQTGLLSQKEKTSQNSNPGKEESIEINKIKQVVVSLEDLPLSGANSENVRLEVDSHRPGLFERLGLRRTRPRRFLAVAPQIDNLSVLLECMYTARLLRKRHQNLDIEILVHSGNQSFIEASGLFDCIHIVDEKVALREMIGKRKPDVLYMPERSLRAQMITLLTGIKIKIGGSRLRLPGRIFKYFQMQRLQDLEVLKKRGYNLFPELTDLKIDQKLLVTDIALPRRDYIWLSLFDEHDLNSAWSVGHAARLARHLHKLGYDVVVPVPPLVDTAHKSKEWRARKDSLAGEVAYLKQNARNLQIITDATPTMRAAGIQRACCLVAPAGPETILAAILGRPVVALHDMKTYRRHPAHLTPAGMEKSPLDGSHQILRQRDLLKKALTQHAAVSTYFIRLADSLESHIRPAVEDCAEHCPDCSHTSCVDHISPERVLDSLTRLLQPF